jgi:hypothetical protein
MEQDLLDSNKQEVRLFPIGVVITAIGIVGILVSE